MSYPLPPQLPQTERPTRKIPAVELCTDCGATMVCSMTGPGPLRPFYVCMSDFCRALDAAAESR